MNLHELPGGDLILEGLHDLNQGNIDTMSALLVSIASIRLTAAGLDLPQHPLMPDPELALYECLEKEQEDPYAYYNALLDSLESFCNALELHFESRPYLLDPG
ncbi:MAG: hypothetical protein ACFCU9_00585 [Cyanophyceae cyanobacterium]